MRSRMMSAAVSVALVGMGMLAAAGPAVASPLSQEDSPGQASQASAAGQTITITGAAVADHTLVAVKIADYTNVLVKGEAPDAHVTTFSLKTTEAARSIANAYAGDQVSGDPIEWIARQTGSNDKGAWYEAAATTPAVRGLANALAKTIDLKNAFTATSGANGQVFTVPAGLYLVLDESEGSSTSQHSLPIIIGTEFDQGKAPASVGYLGTMAIKGDLVSLDKDIVEAIPTGGEGAAAKDRATGDEVEDSWTAPAGGTVDFVIRTNVPHYPASSYSEAAFTIEDSYSAGLTPDIEKLQVFVAGEKDPVAQDWLSATPGTGSFTVTLTPDGIVGLSGKDIEVRYTATVAAVAAGSGITRDTNTADVVFTDLWSTEQAGLPDSEKETGTRTTVTDTDYVYTVPFEITKQNLVAPHELLPGATFEVKKDGAESGVSATTDGDGKAKFVGLSGNTWYTVTETKQPDLYSEANLQGSRTTFQFKADVKYPSEGVEPTVTYEFKDLNATFVSLDQADAQGHATDASDDGSVLVYNAKSASDMPATGGQVLLWVSIAGGLGVGALVFAVLGMRKRRTVA